MTVYAITDTKKGRTGIAPTYLQTTPCQAVWRSVYFNSCCGCRPMLNALALVSEPMALASKVQALALALTVEES